MNGKITYHQQVSFCGKPRCRKCREGTGHGPYWYAYETINGRTTRRYIGKDLPADVQVQDDAVAQAASPLLAEKRPLTEEAEVLTMSAPLRLRISTLGRFDLEWGDGLTSQTVDDDVWEDQWSVRALLALLLCQTDRKVSRQYALETLWPRLRRETSLHRLEETLAHLSTILLTPARVAVPSKGARSVGRRVSLLHLADDTIQLADQSLAWVDATAFEAIIQQIDDLPFSEAEQREKLLREALALYGGDFLPEGRQIAWIMQRRLSLRHRWLGAQLALADLHIQRQDYSRALDSADRLLSIEANNEAAVQRLLIVLARLNRRPEALQVYKRLAQPSEQTRSLYNAIRLGTLDEQTLIRLQLLPGTAQAQTVEPELVPIQFAESTQNVRIGRSHHSPLIGRESELATLRHTLHDIDESGRLQLMEQRRATGIPLDTQRQALCMMLMGVSGIGKTRLAEEMSMEAQKDGWAVVWGRSYDQESAIPYRLWTEILRKVLNLGIWPQLINAGIASTALNPSLRASLEETLFPLTDLLPELSEVLPVQERSSHGQSEHALILQAEQKQLRLWEAVRDLLASTSESAPLLIVLDDIQWADDNSYRLLAYLARNLHGYPIMLLCTCRESEVPKHSPHHLRVIIDQMLREHSVQTLDVHPLTGEQIATLVSHLPGAMVEHIKEHAAGNPFFAEELARTSPPTIPRSIKAALQQRMNKLDKQTRQLLDTAAVLGGSFELPEICAMEAGGREKADLADEDTIVALLEKAMDAGVLSEEGVGTHITYQFWHPMLVSYLYESISAMRRARLHRRAADVLRRMHKGREEEVAATIMHHLAKADADVTLIAHYAQLAGDRAYILSATEPGFRPASAKAVPYTEAEQYYRRALAYLQSASGHAMITFTDTDGAQSSQVVPPPETAPALNDEEKVRFIYLLERIAECTMIRGNFEEARQLYAWVLVLRSDRPRDDASPEAQYEAQLQALLWAEIGWTWRYTGDVPKARSYLERGEQVLRAAGVVAGPAWARLRHQQGSLSIMEGRYPEARLAMQEALALFEQQQQPLASQSGVNAARLTRIQRTIEGYLVDMGQTHKLLAALAEAEGRLHDSLAHLNTALSLFKQCDHKRRMAHAYCDLGHIHLKVGEYKVARDFLQRSLVLAEQLGDEPLMGVIFWNQAELAAAPDQLDLEESTLLYRRAISYQERLNDREYLCKWNAYLAAVLQEQGKLDEAQVCVLRSLSIGRAMHNNHPCIGAALVALSNMRIALAGRAQDLPDLYAHHLRHALRTIQRALALEELEAETRLKGQLTRVQILSLLGEKAQAREGLALFTGAEPQNEFALLALQSRQLQASL